jgi:DNA-binding MarR family transcriptional regulator
VQRLTLREVNEQYNGILPPGAVLRPDDDEEIPPSPARSSKPVAKLNRRTRSQRFATLNVFVDFSQRDLTGSEVRVWLTLFRDTKADGTARTGQADIARRAGLSVRGVQKTINRLEAKGLLQLVRRGRLNTGPSVYRVLATPA